MRFFQWTQTRSVLFEFEFRQIIFLSSRNWLFLFEFKFEFATLIKPFISALLFEFNDFIFVIYCIFWTIKCMINTWPLLLLFSYRRCTIYMRWYLKRSKNCKTLNSSDSNCKEKKSNCNCNYILFTKLPWPGDSEGTFRSSSQAATCPPVYHTRRRLHTVPLIAERQAGKLWIPIFIVFGLTRLGIEPESTASVADTLSTRPLIG